jgi:hypothetical protein
VERKVKSQEYGRYIVVTTETIFQVLFSQNLPRKGYFPVKLSQNKPRKGYFPINLFGVNIFLVSICSLKN